MTMLWAAEDLAQATGGTLSAPFAASGVSIDTRSLVPGDLFVALQGETADGHRFVADALAKGAAGAMVHQDVPGAGPLLRVDDTLAALIRLGGFARARFGGRVVAVTGSVGKTTTKEMLRCILSAWGPTHAAVASYNNHWGVPLTLARLPSDAAFAVVEIGMNHAGEIEPLTRLARPHVAVITAVEKAHIGYLGSLEAIADEKAAILRGLEPGGVAVLPVDSPMLPRLRAVADAVAARVVGFGADASADVRLVDLTMDADGSEVVAALAGETLRFRLNAAGRHMAMNALAAIAASVHLAREAGEAEARSADVSRAAGEVLSSAFVPLSGRGARRTIALPGGPALLLDESYNGNGASIRAALDVLRLQPAARRIAILGDMLELGAAGPAEHAALAPFAADSADLVFTAGPLMRHLFDALPPARRGAHAADSAALIPHVLKAVAVGDAILVKGSLGSRMRRIVDSLEVGASHAVGTAA